MSMKTLDQHIEVTPGITGAKPRIAGHRITVMSIETECVPIVSLGFKILLYKNMQ